MLTTAGNNADRLAAAESRNFVRTKTTEAQRDLDGRTPRPFGPAVR
jgi:hypothetical protein